MSGASSSEWESSEPGEEAGGAAATATTDCESDGAELEEGTADADADAGAAQRRRERRRRRVLCAYEWTKSCSYCFDARLAVVALRVEVLPAASASAQAPAGPTRRQRQLGRDREPQREQHEQRPQQRRRALCHVLGDSPLKALARSRGVALGEVAGPGGALWLSRACAACCAPQGEFELSQLLEAQDDEWLERHRVLELGLPRRLDPTATAPATAPAPVTTRATGTTTKNRR